MNKAMIIGNLTKDPELKTTATGISVCTFTVAVSRTHNREKTDFIPVVTWRGLAESCSRFLKKGRKVGVSGRIQVRPYDDGYGDRRYMTEIIADEVEFLTPRDKPEKDFVPLDESEDFTGVFAPDGSEYDGPLDEEQMPF